MMNRDDADASRCGEIVEYVTATDKTAKNKSSGLGQFGRERETIIIIPIVLVTL